MPKRTRDILLRFFVTAREKAAIQKRMELVGLKNMSTYLRKIATDGYLLNVDLSCFDKMLEDIHGVSKNINQIAKPYRWAQRTIADLLEKLVVHAPDKSSGHRTQQIDIHFRFNVAVATAVADSMVYDRKRKAA